MKTDVKERIAAIETNLKIMQAELEKLKAEDNKEDTKVNCLIQSPEYNDGCYFLTDETECFTAAEYWNDEDAKNNMWFADKEQAERYAEALSTFILLRKQEGTEPAKDNMQWVIELDDEGNICFEDWESAGAKLRCISPCFNSRENAHKAIENLGEERIVNMFKYFHS